jgi:hypothetical protein
MKKPFQFSMARMFAFVTLFCLGAAVYGHAIQNGMHGNLNFFETGAGGAVARCGVGMIHRKAPVWVWAVIGVALSIASIVVIVLFFVLSGAHS